MVWVHGGGYVLGKHRLRSALRKTWTDVIAAGQKRSDVYNPSGLISRAQLDDSEGVVYVALNYRMGLFGFLNGVDGVFPNIGLQDQRLAFDWYVVPIKLNNMFS